MTEFGRLLKYYRERFGISQAKLGSRAGFDHSYISRLEAGNRDPTREAVLRLALALELAPMDTDRLLAAADFRPTDIRSVLFEPTLADLDDLIAAAHEPLQTGLRGMVQMAILAGRNGMTEKAAA